MQAFHLGMCHLQDETAHEAQNSEGKERKELREENYVKGVNGITEIINKCFFLSVENVWWHESY